MTSVIDRIASLTRHVTLRFLHDPGFLREIHHFLWTEPSLIGSAVDVGWSCRDHAWLTALLARSLGFAAAFCHGEALFAAAPKARSAGLSFAQNPHSWVIVEDVGAIDLSTKPKFQVGGDEYQLPITCVFGNGWLPHDRCQVAFFDDAAAYAQAARELPRQRNRATAIYLATEAEALHAGHLTHAAGWIRSSLADLLGATYGDPSDLYCALLLHLHALLRGEAQSLTGLPRGEAWRWLARVRDGAFERASRLSMFNADALSSAVTQAV